MRIEEVITRFDNVVEVARGTEYKATCPCHNDKKQSLYIGKGDKGNIVIHCFADCPTDDVLNAVGLRYSDIANADSEPKKSYTGFDFRNVVATYDYGNGTRKLRDRNKNFIWQHRDNDKWVSGRGKASHVPYIKGNESDTVYIVEGEKDTENLSALGLYCASSENGAGKNSNGKKWFPEYNALFTGKDVRIIPDNDSTGANFARIVANELVGVSKSVKIFDLATVYPELPEKGDISDVIQALGADATRSILATLEDSTNIYVATEDVETEEENSARSKTKLPRPYMLKDKCLYMTVIDKKGNESVSRLLNGWVETKSVVTQDDGADQEDRVYLTFHGNNGRDTEGETTIKDLYNGNYFPIFGIEARPAVGSNKRAYITDSILAQADNAPHKVTYLHTGWRIIDGKYDFLTAHGALLHDNVNVALQGIDKQYYFPEEPSPERYKTFQRLLNLASERIIYPLLSFTFLCPLNEPLRKVGREPRTVLWIQGVTQSGKTTLASFFLNFFGEEWHTDSLHNFRSTANSLEKTGFLLADVLTVVDDLFPAVSRIEANKMASVSQNLIRSYGDRTGRGRMRADGTQQTVYAPRGNLLCTGEDFPNMGQSGTARTLIIELKKGDTDTETMYYLKEHTADLAGVMKDYLLWLAPQMPTLPKKLLARYSELIKRANGLGYGRTAEAIAHLQLSFEMLLVFLTETKHIELDTETEERFRNDAWDVFTDLMQEQQDRISEDKPSKLFVDALREMLTTEQYIVEDLTKVGIDETICNGDRFLGYRDSDYYYLLPRVVFRAVVTFYNQSGINFPLTSTMLYKHLKEENLIAVGKDQTTRNKNLHGKNVKCLWVYRSVIDAPEGERRQSDDIDFDSPL